MVHLCQFFCSVTSIFFFNRQENLYFVIVLWKITIFLFLKLNIHSSLKCTLKWSWLDRTGVFRGQDTVQCIPFPTSPPPPPPVMYIFVCPSFFLFYFKCFPLGDKMPYPRYLVPTFCYTFVCLFCLLCYISSAFFFQQVITSLFCVFFYKRSQFFSFINVYSSLRYTLKCFWSDRVIMGQDPIPSVSWLLSRLISYVCTRLWCSFQQEGIPLAL